MVKAHTLTLVQKMGRKHLHSQEMLFFSNTTLDEASSADSGTGQDNRAARVELGFTIRANINNMHNQLTWLKVDERLKTSLLFFINYIFHFKIPDCLYKQLTLRDDKYSYPTRHAIRNSKSWNKLETTSSVVQRHCWMELLSRSHF